MEHMQNKPFFKISAKEREENVETPKGQYA